MDRGVRRRAGVGVPGPAPLIPPAACGGEGWGQTSVRQAGDALGLRHWGWGEQHISNTHACGPKRNVPGTAVQTGPNGGW